MNRLIIGSSLCWLFVFAAMFKTLDDPILKAVALIIILANIIASIFYFKVNDIQKNLELRIYTDHLCVILTIMIFPICFFGFYLQVLLSLMVNHFYLKNKICIYKFLIFTTVFEIILCCVACSLKITQEVICNAVALVALAFIIFVIKNKLVNSENKYKQIVDNVQKLFKCQVIDAITPMYYYIHNLDEFNKARMTSLINRLKNIAQESDSNFGKMITLVRSSLFSTDKPVNITFINDSIEEIKMDSFALLLSLYVIFDCSVASNASEITVKFDSKQIIITDNGEGFEKRAKPQLSIACELFELFDISIKISSVFGTGTKFSLTL